MDYQWLLNLNQNGLILRTSWVRKLKKKEWQSQNLMQRTFNLLSDLFNDFESMHISLRSLMDRNTSQTLILKKRNNRESESRRTKWKKKRMSILMRSFEFDLIQMGMDSSYLMKMLSEFTTEFSFFNTFERH